jgi:hypothetical protein
MIDLVMPRAELPAALGRLVRLYVTANRFAVRKELVGSRA